MLSIEFIRQNKEKVIAAAQNKNRVVDIDKVLDFDDKRKTLIQRIQKLREERNALAQSPQLPPPLI
jgi:seryl-tRNA synthetase